MLIKNRFTFTLLAIILSFPALAAPGWNPLDMGLNGAVNVVVIHGSDVYVGGNFTDAGGDPDADCLARWDGSNWHAVAAGIFPPFQVYSIAISGSNIYVGGTFPDINGNTNLRRIARWDGSSWNALGTGLNSTVYSIAINGSDVYVGGGFSNAGNVGAADFLARWNGSTWSAVGSGNLNGIVRSLVLNGSNLYVGGQFTDAGGNADADRVARWNGSSWNSLGTSALSNGFVNAIAIAGNDVYVGGSFTDAAGNPSADRIARFDGANWHALGTGIANAVSTVFTLAYDGAHLFVGGTIFDAGGNTAADHIARWTGSTWEGLGINLGGAVRSISITPDNLYVGGDFSAVPGNPNLNHVARYEYDALPVELSRFEATAHPEGVWLRWQTESETANDYFEVEHGTDGARFAPIGRQKGAGNSVQTQRYAFLHPDPPPGLHYYRLRQVDFDGTEHLSPIRGVRVAGSAPTLSPNPATDHFRIRGLGETPARLRVFDTLGRLLREGEAREDEPVVITDFPGGTYWVELRQGAVGQRFRVVKR